MHQSRLMSTAALLAPMFLAVVGCGSDTVDEPQGQTSSKLEASQPAPEAPAPSPADPAPAPLPAEPAPAPLAPQPGLPAPPLP